MKRWYGCIRLTILGSFFILIVLLCSGCQSNKSPMEKSNKSPSEEQIQQDVASWSWGDFTIQEDQVSVEDMQVDDNRCLVDVEAGAYDRFGAYTMTVKLLYKLDPNTDRWEPENNEVQSVIMEEEQEPDIDWVLDQYLSQKENIDKSQCVNLTLDSYETDLEAQTCRVNFSFSIEKEYATIEKKVLAVFRLVYDDMWSVPEIEEEEFPAYTITKAVSEQDIIDLYNNSGKYTVQNIKGNSLDEMYLNADGEEALKITMEVVEPRKYMDAVYAQEVEYVFSTWENTYTWNNNSSGSGSDSLGTLVSGDYSRVLQHLDGHSFAYDSQFGGRGSLTVTNMFADGSLEFYVNESIGSGTDPDYFIQGNTYRTDVPTKNTLWADVDAEVKYEMTDVTGRSRNFTLSLSSNSATIHLGAAILFINGTLTEM